MKMRETLMEPTSAEVIARRWKWLLAVGILSVIGGTFAIIVPLAASISATILVGWAMLFGAAAQLLAAIQEHATSDRIIHGLFALLYAAAGFYLLLFPVSGTITLTVVLVAFFFAAGVIRLFLAAQAWNEEGALWLAASGAIAIVLGILILVDFPSSAAWALGLIVGIELLLAGWQLIALALAARSAVSDRTPGVAADRTHRPATGTGF
jgi:uncharacterized membrane protein HdeD (DUF308 family)